MLKFVKKHVQKLIVLVIVIAVIMYFFMRSQQQASLPPLVEVDTIMQSELINSVNISGTVASKNTKKVYTKLTLPVDKNLVEVGDRVAEGDILCELDITSVENQIEQQSAAASAQAAINSNTIALSQKGYMNAREDVVNDQNTKVAQAEQALTAAKQTLERAEISYEGTVDRAQSARETYRSNDLDVNKDALDAAINARDLAYANYEAAKQGVIDAENNLSLTKHGVSEQLESAYDSVHTSQVAAASVNSQWVAIENLKDSLEDAVVKAPISGVVTAVYVTEGATATGLLYVIEDTTNLKVVTALKEYDLSLVTEGDIVEIKSDVTGTEIFDGKVSKIAPTTTKTPTGENASAANPEFETEINVTAEKKGLRIGTKARMDIIYEKKTDTINVSYEALGTDEQGNSIVFVLDEEAPETGVYVLRAVPVTLGMESDFRVEITGEGLAAGTVVLMNTEGMTDGMRVQINPTVVQDAPPAGGSLGEARDMAHQARDNG